MLLEVVEVCHSFLEFLYVLWVTEMTFIILLFPPLPPCICAKQSTCFGCQALAYREIQSASFSFRRIFLKKLYTLKDILETLLLQPLE
jgi:hypothetical protein